MDAPAIAVRALLAVATLTTVATACGRSDGPTKATTTTAAPVTTTTSSPDNFPQAFEPMRDGSLEGVRAKATTVAQLDAPTALAGRPGTDDLYVTERAGRVMVLRDPGRGGGRAEPEVALDLRDQTTTDANRGMVGIAFSADGSQVYLSHTNARGDSRVARYDLDGRTIDPGSRVEVLKIDQPYDDHNVDAIHLGPDGRLWVATGDGGGIDDPDQRAQDPDDIRGKVLAIDPEHPDDVEVYARGLRNPFRFSFDRATGDLWLGDVGQESTEEIDHLPAGTPAGSNFGWSGFEGTTVKEPSRVEPGSTPPVFEAAHTEGWCAIVGGAVYHGRPIAGLDGAYVFGDVCQPQLHALRFADGKVTDERTIGVPTDTLVSIDQDLRGDLWLLSLDGAVARLDPA